jgi:hypothetical protein
MNFVKPAAPPWGSGALRLAKKDRVVTMEVLDPDQPADLLVVSEKGFGKRTR